MPSGRLLVSIVVPTLNEAPVIGQTLRALAALDGCKEILVVDGESTDETAGIARGLVENVIQSPRGKGVQMDAGAAAARGEVLWFVHADTLPPESALTMIEEALTDAAVCGGNFELRFDGTSAAARQLTAIYPHLRKFGLCYGDSGIFVRKSIYYKAGGTGGLPLFEDVDLVRRVRRYGRFVHLPGQLVTSSRRFEHRNFAGMWAQWTALQLLYWCGVPPRLLASFYGPVRAVAGKR
jgi:rSAM/selenodomain-associated transferase 2